MYQPSNNRMTHRFCSRLPTVLVYTISPLACDEECGQKRPERARELRIRSCEPGSSTPQHLQVYRTSRHIYLLTKHPHSFTTIHIRFNTARQLLSARASCYQTGDIEARQPSQPESKSIRRINDIIQEQFIRRGGVWFIHPVITARLNGTGGACANCG